MAVVQGKKERSNFYVVKHFLFRQEVTEGAGLGLVMEANQMVCFEP